MMLFLSNGIECLLERLSAYTAIGGEEFLAGLTQCQIGIDDLADRIGDFVAGESGTQDGADRGILGGRAAKGDLVIFLAFLIESQNSDMADMMMAAGIDAARDIDLQRADLLLARHIGEFA